MRNRSAQMEVDEKEKELNKKAEKLKTKETKLKKRMGKDREGKEGCSRNI